MSKIKIYFNISSLVAPKNENKGCLFDLFLHTSPIVSMPGWFLYFKITLRIGSETFSNRESLWGLYPGILRFFTMFEKKEFSNSEFCYLQKLIHHFQLTRFTLLKLSCPIEKVSLFYKMFCYH